MDQLAGALQTAVEQPVPVSLEFVTKVPRRIAHLPTLFLQHSLSLGILRSIDRPPTLRKTMRFHLSPSIVPYATPEMK